MEDLLDLDTADNGKFKKKLPYAGVAEAEAGAGWAYTHPDFGSSGAPHYYLPTQIFRPYNILELCNELNCRDLSMPFGSWAMTTGQVPYQYKVVPIP